LTQVFPAAYIGGRYTGLNMSGKNIECKDITSCNSFTILDFQVISFGNFQDLENEFEVLTSQNTEKNLYKKIVIKDDVIKGGIFFNCIDRCGIIYGLMRNKNNICEFKDKILTDNFGLIYLPKKLRDEILL